jgi:hypothetical protein
MRRKSAVASVLAAAVAVPLLASGAQAGLWGYGGGHTNDTGGIIPWSPEIAHTYRDIAAAECARWDKVAIITSVHRVYGDYVGFACHYPRWYDPRKARLGEPVIVTHRTRVGVPLVVK